MMKAPVAQETTCGVRRIVFVTTIVVIVSTLVVLAVVLSVMFANWKNSLPTWQQLPELPRAEDVNDDPRVVEVHINARLTDVSFLPGVRSVAWTYHNATPGPLIEARVGDELRLHFTNNLPEQTTIHWHGV